MNLNVTLTQAQKYNYVRLFWEKNLPNINFENVPKTITNMSGSFPVNEGNNTYSFTLDDSPCFSFAKGDKVYITAYGDAFLNNSYVDPQTKAIVFPSINLDRNVTPASVIY